MSIIKFIAIAILTIYSTVILGIHKIRLKNNTNYYSICMKIWAVRLVKIAGVSIEIQGLSNINPNENYIFIANHTGFIDIPILLSAIPHTLHFMYRQSLRKIPVIGYALKMLPFIPIVRENNKNASIGLDIAAKTIKERGSVLLFPEGTRSKTGELGKFKRGAFLLALNSNIKIVPITISGVNNITPRNKRLKIKNGNVLIKINKPIEQIPTERDKLLEFISSVRNDMIQQLQ